MEDNSQMLLKEYVQNNHNKDLKNKLLNLIKNVPESNGISYYNKMDLNIAIMTDDFMFNYYKDAANLMYIDYANYTELLDNNKIDVFLFISCWGYILSKGFTFGNFSYAIQRQRIYEIINACKFKNIPTVFQSIEDPINYNVFLDIAKKCDYIFTSDKDIIDNYKKDCNNDKVYYLEYGINPKIHNPIGIKANEKIDSVLFAGSWYGSYEQRCKDMQNLFDGVIESEKGLDIINRFFDIDNIKHYYPKKYIPYTAPSINHLDLQKVHKLYNWIINLNTVKYSSTMCAMRIYEAQALGNIIFSNYSIAVNNYNPNVFTIINKEEIGKIIKSYDDEKIYKHQVYGIRNVMTNKTVFERLKYLLDTIGINNNQSLDKKVLVVTPQITEKIKNMFNIQTLENKFLIEEKNIKEFYHQYDFVAYFKDDYSYEEYYLQDMINGFKYTNSDYITKDSYYINKELVKGIEHNYINVMKDKYKTIFKRSSYEADYIININENTELINGYSIDPFELNINNTNNLNSIENIDTINETIDQNNKSYDLSIIIPIYNNGKHLLYKGFISLLRSSMFNKMEIILVDDGSTDLETITIIDRIKREYSNVKVFKYEQGGSGSASRPRNKGIELSTCDYITFLDPDDEAINDGYYKLYNEINNSEYDFVFGYSIMMTNKEYIFKYSKERIIDNPREDILMNKFHVNRIHTLIIKKNLITDNNLNMIEGAIGEDSLFFIELMLNSKKVKAIDEVIQIYYGSVENSVTNIIDVSFYKKYYKLHSEMVKRLQNYNVLNEYITLRLEPYFEYWFMEKMKQASKDDIPQISDILVEILKMYNYTKIKSNRIMRFFSYAKNKDYSKIVQEFLN